MGLYIFIPSADGLSWANIPPLDKIAEAAPISNGSTLGAHPPFRLISMAASQDIFAYLEGTVGPTLRKTVSIETLLRRITQL